MNVIHTQDADFTLLNCDVMDGLATLPDESVHCVVTSPPYWGLRDYGTGLWEGGDSGCDHTRPSRQGRHNLDKQSEAGSPALFDAPKDFYAETCGKCGARRQDHQLGLEPSPDAYVARMVEVFREIRRVLRADGTCWVNLGDSYASGEVGRVDAPAKNALLAQTQKPRAERRIQQRSGLKPKDLVGIPWRVAFALQADGWYLRSEITWCKPNCMPESVTDRPTKATEKVFLLTKAPRYYYDAEAVRTEHQRDNRAITEVIGRDGSIQHRNGERWPGTGANLRDWWLIATQAFPEAHFATYPEELVRRCILAGTSEQGCCPVCGRPWERETNVEREMSPVAAVTTDKARARAEGVGIYRSNSRETGGVGGLRNVTTLGWRPGCDCGSEYPPLSDKNPSSLVGVPWSHEEAGLVPIPCTVLDPFLGSGTTAFVARKHGRRSIGIELSPEYCELAARRMAQQSLFAEAP